MSKFWIYYGTGTTGEGQGIYRQAFDADSLELGEVQLAADGPKTGFQYVTGDESTLYSAVSDGPLGAVRAYSIDKDNGSLSLLNQVSTKGGGLCYVGMDRSEKFILGASYGDAVVSVLSTEDDGSVGEPVFTTQHEGTSGVRPDRQEAAHAHSIYADPTNEYVFVCDLGKDQIVVYRLNKETGELGEGPMAFARTNPGAGPRHLAFHRNGKWVYSINELEGSVTHFVWDALQGTLLERASTDTLPEEFEGGNTTAEILVSSDGRFVYGSNRGHDSLVVYSVDQETGVLTLVQREDCRGQHPRNFNIDPTGKVLVCANRDTDNVSFFKIDEASGKIEYVKEAGVKAAICVRFVTR
ncbi:MAG: lactonase family protein [Verrucomicrobiota bacterium]